MLESHETRALPTVGAVATRALTFSPEAVAQFADLVGDRNPLHLDAEFASHTVFGKPIVHGMLVSGLISGILGEDLPGPGSIYLGQTLRFEAPVYVGETITASAEVTAVRPEKRIVTLKTECVNEAGARVISGEATIKVA